MENHLGKSVSELPGTSIVTVRRLKSLNIKTYWDLLNYFPFRYEDYSQVSPLTTIQEGETVTVKGEVTSATQVRTRRRLTLQKFILEDDLGKIELAWYNQPYLLTLLKKGVQIYVSGLVKKSGNKLSILPKEYEPVKDKQLHTGRLVPIYPEKRGLSSRTIREKINHVLDFIRNDAELEFLPENLLVKNNLLGETDAYKNIHFPQNKTTAQRARSRLAYDEIFIIQLSSAQVRQQWKDEKVTNPLKPHQSKLDQFIKLLPFTLTGSQKKVTTEILNDLNKNKPMNRFLQGEVGSGKTVVAAITCYLSFLNGYKSLFMAPTEILANQHYLTIQKLFKNQKSPPSIVLITAATKPTKQEIERADIIIGTHTLIQKKLAFNKIGLVIIDEQHRFGVAQRALLKKKGMNPHLLTMTATPIPRTVALTLYGELDMSVIDQMPIGRIPVKTFFVPKIKREKGYYWIREMIKKEQAQVFIICPLIEESTVETMKSVRAAKYEYEFLKSKIFPDLSVALLHGKMKSVEKNKVMQEFTNKKYDILVSTSVVEVGVDVPTATIMLIEGAERYGLAQLHQLRGRVGRGDKQSYCFLFTELENKYIIDRLKFFASTESGAKLAEYDLAKRGAGEIYGIKQHGTTELKIATLTDHETIEKAKKAVVDFQENYDLKKFPLLKKRLETYRTNLISKD